MHLFHSRALQGQHLGYPAVSQNQRQRTVDTDQGSTTSISLCITITRTWLTKRSQSHIY